MTRCHCIHCKANASRSLPNVACILRLAFERVRLAKTRDGGAHALLDRIDAFYYAPEPQRRKRAR